MSLGDPCYFLSLLYLLLLHLKPTTLWAQEVGPRPSLARQNGLSEITCSSKPSHLPRSSSAGSIWPSSCASQTCNHTNTQLPIPARDGVDDGGPCARAVGYSASSRNVCLPSPPNTTFASTSRAYRIDQPAHRPRLLWFSALFCLFCLFCWFCWFCWSGFCCFSSR